MKKDDEIIWVDKSAIIIPIIVAGFFLLLAVTAVIQNIKDPYFSIPIWLLFISVVIYYKFFSADTKPLQVTKNGLILSEGKHFSRTRELILFKDIKSLKVGPDKGGSRMEFVYVVDKNGKKYRNVIFEVSKLKEAIKDSLKVQFEDFGQYNFLPKNWR